MAALLSVRGDSQKQMERYIKVSRDMKITVEPPDINKSKRFFTPLEQENKILFGLERVSGIGLNKVEEIIENQPYESLKEVTEKLPKKVFNKTVGKNLIKAGAFREFEENRYKLLNDFYDIRKDKDERYSIDEYTEDACIEFEKDTLETPITYLPYWDKIKANSKITEQCIVVSLDERTDKKGGLMAFGDVKIQNSILRIIVFASKYKKIRNDLSKSLKEGTVVSIKGKKDEKDTFIVNEVIKSQKRFNMPQVSVI